MIDRFGNPIRVGWPQHHIVWIEAVLTLPREQRTAAYQDIADMAGRGLDDVRSKAYWLQEQKKKAALFANMMAAQERTRRVMVPERGRISAGRPPCIPSTLRQPTKQQKMGAR